LCTRVTTEDLPRRITDMRATSSWCDARSDKPRQDNQALSKGTTTGRKEEMYEFASGSPPVQLLKIEQNTVKLSQDGGGNRRPERDALMYGPAFPFPSASTAEDQPQRPRRFGSAPRPFFRQRAMRISAERRGELGMLVGGVGSRNVAVGPTPGGRLRQTAALLLASDKVTPTSNKSLR